MLVWRIRCRMRLCAACGRRRGWCDLRAGSVNCAHSVFDLRASPGAINIRLRETRGTTSMESINAARRTEDIALDLLKFVASHTNVASKAVSATGFGVTTTANPEEQVGQFLELYPRCRQVVEAPVESTSCRPLVH